MNTIFRHNLTDGAIVNYVSREGGDNGPTVVVHIEDVAASTRIGLQITTLAQARAFRQIAEQAEAALEQELSVPEIDVEPRAEGAREVVAQWATGEEK
jgi:hypothetical protein